MRRFAGFVCVCVGLCATGSVGAAEAPATAAVASIVATKTHLDFKAGGDLVARYVVDGKVAKPYFWPLQPLPGKAVTRGWPMEDAPGEAKDHVHQKSAWFCHGDVIPEGIDFTKHIKGVAGVDFWSEHKGHGKIVCVEVGKPVQQGNHARVTTRNEWRTAEGQKILDETRTIHLHTLGRGTHLLVLDIELRASVCPITFGDTKEGSMGIRVRETVRADRKGTLVNAEGKKGEGAANNVARTGCWGLVSAWCDYSGPVDDAGSVAGIAVFADPANKLDTAWHARNYGLLAANPFGRKKSGFPARRSQAELVRLAKGEQLRLRYGLFLHTGDAVQGKVADHFATFTKRTAR